MDKKKAIESFNFPVIGRVHSCYKEKFGIPRQSGLVTAAQARIEIVSPYNNPEAFYGLEHCSHLWLQFVFHRSLEHQWRPRVRPPRLGGNKTLGVFATRSPVRPSALGLSVVALDRIETERELNLYVRGGDLLDGTPIIDIKPYVPYADCIDSAKNAIADTPPALLPVYFCAKAEEQLSSIENSQQRRIIIEQVLQQDPRPSYQKTDGGRIYGMKIFDFDLKWRYLESNCGDLIEVVALDSDESGNRSDC